MNKIDIIKEYLPDMNIRDQKVTISLLNPGRRRKERYLVETERQKKIVKFFKRNLLELFQKEVDFRYWKIVKNAPQLEYYNIKLERTNINEQIKGDDFMFFVEEFINGKTLNQILSESKMIYSDFHFINKAFETYKEVFSITYNNNFILKNANPNNIVFREWDIKNPYIVDRTAMKNIIWFSKKTLENEYSIMLDNNINNIILKYIK